jgi:hypothetical protein
MMRSSHCIVAAIMFPALAMAQTWQQLPTSVPTTAAVFDASRHRLLLVGTDTQQRIHEWDGASIRERQDELAGQKVVQHLRWDAALSRVIALSEDRWVGTWGGGSWTWQTGGTPPPTGTCSVAFDAHRRRLVVVQYSLAYEWDGQQWWTITGSQLPAAVVSAFAYDPISERCLLYSGAAGQFQGSFSWDGGTWTQLPSTNQPGLRGAAGMALDPTRQQLVLFGGSATATDTWTWNGTSWTQVPTTSSPGPCQTQHLTASDQGVVLVSTSGSNKGDIWQLSGTSWSRAGYAAPEPPSLPSTPFVYDPVRSVLVGWNNGTTMLFDRRWQEVHATTSPGNRNKPQFAWSSIDQRAILFGGLTATTWGDTWAWNGSDWQALQPQHSPSPRYGAMMVEDPAGGVMLFGGTDLQNWFGDQWHWDGTDWQSVTPPNMPPARAHMQAGYSPTQAVAVMFAGYTTSATYFDETWLWNGTTWSHPATTVVPGASALAAVNPANGRVLMVTQNTTYEWTGSDWSTLLNLGHSQPYSPFPRLATHFGRGQLLVCQPPVMRLLTNLRADTEPFGSSCSFGPAPALAAIDEPAPDTGFAVELTARSPGAPSFLVVGLAAQNTPLGNGCRSLVAMQLAVNFALADGSGIARYPIPIPNAPDLRGVRFTTQGAVWNPSQSPLGSAALSAGLLITIGD